MRHSGTQNIETPRLLLRRFTTADAEEMFANWASDARVAQYMRWSPHSEVNFTRQILRDWIKQYDNEDFYLWGIVRKEDGVLMGSLGILPSIEDFGENAFEPGYCIGQSFWGQGYTTEALKAALAYFIDTTGAQTLYCCHANENPASGRVMQKAGFKFTHNGSYTNANGQPVNARFYELAAKDLAR